eukprot:TRINITY_DN5838_c0_g1_i8.p1 TRINITY_DN5838_c0_g1~~TRINITY_DN5838_c0_g1_i8.p1  ORF type:complete len:145 (+),score=5.80 TRINITY_DN5838_c0_g1_i8:67-501(+)
MCIRDRYRAQLPDLKKRYEAIIESFKPDKTIELKAATRYSSSPPWKNTFVNLQPERTSAMYMSERDRFTKDPLSRIQFQKEEKCKLDSINNGRLSHIKMSNSLLFQRIQESEQKSDQRTELFLKKKGLRQYNYEQRCHLRNDYA